MKPSNLLTIAFISISINACSTMFGDNTRNVTINTTPNNADVIVDGNHRGMTPAHIAASNYIWNGQTIMLKKDGYKDSTIYVRSQFQYIGLLNILNGGIGFIIDAVTGDMMKLSLEDLNQNINLSPVKKQS